MESSGADKLEKAGAASESYAGGSTPVQPCPLTRLHWVEVQLVDEEGVGIAGQRYELKLPDGARRWGKTDADGVLSARDFEFGSGRCMVNFPDLDGHAWELVS